MTSRTPTEHTLARAKADGDAIVVPTDQILHEALLNGFQTALGDAYCEAPAGQVCLSLNEGISNNVLSAGGYSEVTPGVVPDGTTVALRYFESNDAGGGSWHIALARKESIGSGSIPIFHIHDGTQFRRSGFRYPSASVFVCTQSA